MKPNKPASAGSRPWLMLAWLLLGPLPLLLVLALQSRREPVELQRATAVSSRSEDAVAAPKPTDPGHAKKVPAREVSQKPGKVTNKTDTDRDRLRY